MRHTTLYVSLEHTHGCHCTTGDIIVFQACTALTSLNLASPYDSNVHMKFTGKFKENSDHIESSL